MPSELCKMTTLTDDDPSKADDTPHSSSSPAAEESAAEPPSWLHSLTEHQHVLRTLNAVSLLGWVVVLTVSYSTAQIVLIPDKVWASQWLPAAILVPGTILAVHVWARCRFRPASHRAFTVLDCFVLATAVLVFIALVSLTHTVPTINECMIFCEPGEYCDEARVSQHGVSPMLPYSRAGVLAFLDALTGSPGVTITATTNLMADNVTTAGSYMVSIVLLVNGREVVTLEKDFVYAGPASTTLILERLPVWTAGSWPFTPPAVWDTLQGEYSTLGPDNDGDVSWLK